MQAPQTVLPGGSQATARRIRGEMEVSSAGQENSAIPPESCPHLHYDEVTALLHIGEPQSNVLNSKLYEKQARYLL